MAAAAGSRPGFPICALCGTNLMLCSCKGHPHGQDVVFPFPKLPEDATAVQRMERWMQHVTRNPAAGRFDAHRWLQDMQAQGLLERMLRLRPRLEAMTAHYCLDSTEGGCLELWQGMQKRMPAGTAFSRESCQEEVETAVKRFCTFDWSRMNRWEIMVVGNVYECSDPIEYPLMDADLQLGWQVLDALQIVTDLASERLPFAFEPFDWQ